MRPTGSCHCTSPSTSSADRPGLHPTQPSLLRPDSAAGDRQGCVVRRICVQRVIGSPNSEQLGFSHIDGSPGASGGSALTPHAGQIGDTSASSVSSHRSLIATVSPPSRHFVRTSKLCTEICDDLPLMIRCLVAGMDRPCRDGAHEVVTRTKHRQDSPEITAFYGAPQSGWQRGPRRANPYHNQPTL